jgi:hypothetical protein
MAWITLPAPGDNLLQTVSLVLERKKESSKSW